MSTTREPLRTTTLARVMWILGAFGWMLVALALAFWLTLDFGLQSMGRGIVGFLSLLFTGTFFAGLCQAWFCSFAALSGRALVEPSSHGTRRGVLLGGSGIALLLAMVSAVLTVGASGVTSASVTSVVLIVTLIVLAGLLVFQHRWVGEFATRSGGL